MQAVVLAEEDVRSAMRDRLAEGAAELGDFDAPEMLAKAVKSARAANNGPITTSEAREAEAIARRYTLLL